MTNRREIMPPSGFSTPPHIPNINTNERPPVTTTVFAATTPGNKPFVYRASTSTDPTLMISLAFVEANYEILKSLLRDSRREPLSTLHKEGLFADPTRSVTPFVYWIEDYPLPDGLKMPSHVGSYNGKGDLDNFLHLFEGAIRM
ncbi:hypothetical protein Tco_0865153 [Tanacetum coccineum]